MNARPRTSWSWRGPGQARRACWFIGSRSSSASGRENPRGILALAYNRHAAAEIRKRLRELIGEDARGVTILTCHALAMRLVGASFRDRKAPVRHEDFDEVLAQAVSLLNGDGLEREAAEAQRDALIEGYRWILVDEYQDIGPLEYALIAAIAGRSAEDEDRRLSLFAVGDDDQNIYAFSGTMIWAEHRIAAARTWRSSGSGRSRPATRGSKPVTRHSSKTSRMTAA